MQQKFVLDTNILLDDPKCFLAFENCHVVLPYEVLLELEAQKTRDDIIGKNARESIRTLEELREKGSLINGISLDHGGIIQISKPQELDIQNKDLFILKVAKELEGELITNDLSMRLRAEAHGVPSNPFKWSKKNLDYRDRTEVSLSLEQRVSLFQEKKVKIENECYPNEFLIADGAIGKYKDGYFQLFQGCPPAYGLKPRSKEQEYALHVLKDTTIPLVSLTGKAGCGKTLLAMAAALDMALEHSHYDRIIITRPIQPLGKDIGYLPGQLSEKLAPWIQPLQDALLTLCEGKKMNIPHLFDQGRIEIQALTYIRGRSLPKVFMIVDEAQNLSRAEIKAIVTRMGENSKLVFTGDLNQIDTNRSDKTNNGLFYLIDKMKTIDLSAHINLIKGERSSLATIAADLL